MPSLNNIMSEYCLTEGTTGSVGSCKVAPRVYGTSPEPLKPHGSPSLQTKRRTTSRELRSLKPHGRCNFLTEYCLTEETTGLVGSCKVAPRVRLALDTITTHQTLCCTDYSMKHAVDARAAT